jgi:chitin synthase
MSKLILPVGFPELICPRQDVFSYAELAAFNGKGHNKAYIAMRGIVYDLGSFAPRHYPPIVQTSAVLKYAGRDATNLFPVQVSALCTGTSGSVDPAVQLDYQNTNYSSMNTLVSAADLNAKYHDFRWFTNDSRPDWWWEQQYTLKNNYMKGHVGYTPQYIATLANKQTYIAFMYGKVYDMTAYIIGGRVPQYPTGEAPPDNLPVSDFMDEQVVGLFRGQSGSDVTKYWESLAMSASEKSAQKVCLDNLFYVGDLDTRNSTQCLFAKYLLLSISILLVSVICFKFLAALQFGKKNVPENLDKFVICTIPAYTEDEDSLRRAIDSAARMKYDDKRKLLVVICDGVIVGEGNDRSTPRIVLDILGVSETIDPDPLSFESLGNGEKQHNMGKVFSGLYEVQGHIVPFLVVVKVGNPKETQR